MNKIIITAISLAIIPGIASAQRTNPHNETVSPPDPKAAELRGSIMTFSDLDQRKIYHWGNGQISTPTGRQAGEDISKYVKVFGDSAVVVPAPYTDRKK